MTNKNDKHVSEKKEKVEKNEQPEQKNASQPVSASFPPLFSQLEAINSATHQALYYHPATKDDFARKTHALPLVLQEITAAALDTPVLFIREGDIWGIIALVGIRAGEGCRVDENGHWQGYRPLYLRFYPFTTGVTETETLLCLDRGFAGLNEEKGNGGHPLFNEDGTPGTWLVQVNSDMAGYTLARKTTGEALALLAKLELLQPATARVVTSSGVAADVKLAHLPM